MSRLRTLADYHIHTVRCGHARGNPAEYVEAALAAGLGEIGFSCHVPMYWLSPDRRDPTVAMPEEQLGDYVADVLALRERFPAIPIRLGIEADYIPGREGDLVRLLAPYPWDYVIGSVHFLEDWGFDNPAEVAGYGRWNLWELYQRFFDLELQAARSGLFDVLAHLDLIKKFGHRPDRDLTDLYGAVADHVAAAGVAVELSTAGLRKPVNEYYPHCDLLAALAARGVPLVISSDAHRPAEVGLGFAEAASHAAALGFRQTCRFAGRRRSLVPLA